MNNVFLWLNSKGKKVIKYFIFSILFVLTFFVSTNNVGAAGELLEGRAYSPNTKTDGITSLDGTLLDSCDAPITDEFMAYKLIGGSHNGADANSYANCVAYKDTTNAKQYFYVQATDDSAKTNKIKFTIKGVPNEYKYVTVFEPGFSLTNEDGYDYDYYTHNGTNYGSGVRRYAGADTKTMTGKISYAAVAGGYDYTFEYELRNDAFGEQYAYVYFYTATPNANNESKKAKLSYILAKPIDEFQFTSGKDASTCSADSGTNDYVCVDYTSNPNTGTAVAGTVTNKFSISFNDKAAVYFSTINTHEEEKTVDNIKTYNSVYAVNTFYNEGLTSNPIVFYYYNIIDKTTYTPATGALSSDAGYSYEMTIDASGSYAFYLEDIFGNELIKPAFKVDVDDVSNRELTIYFIAYKADGSVDVSGTTIDKFHVANDLANLTGENVKIGLEFYYKVLVSEDFAVQSSGTILNNPLSEDMIRMRENDAANGDQKTYFCRQGSHNSSDCVEASKGSNFTKQVLRSSESQSISATTDGLKALTNGFVYDNGKLSTVAAYNISSTIKKNRVDFLVNENGRFFVRVQDRHGNSKTGTIDVSIIDQLNPVITLNGQLASLNNWICSSMYVIGAGGTIQTYPTDVLDINDCGTGNSVLYNHFEEVDATNGTTKQPTITLKVERPTGEYKTNTNGFYNIDTNTVAFNYADAIRMALLRISDSISIYNGTSFEKSKYEKTSNDYTAYGLYSLDGNASWSAMTIGTSFKTGRVGYNNTKIIETNYIQYSSELDAYVAAGNEFVDFKVYAKTAAGADSSLVCSSIDGRQDCYDIVNAYIDKSISFKLVFVAKDIVGNLSDEVTLNIDVVDDTTPGISAINTTTGAISDPIIAKNNVDTDCRLEIGAFIQTKAQLLECYGLTATGAYNFVDNATGYDFISKENKDSNNYFLNVLKDQLYTYTASDDTYYDKYVKVYVCQIKGKNKCSDAQWKEVTNVANSIDFQNAGDYEIKFVITDTKGDYAEQSSITNTTVVIMCYYVNPRVLLVRPLETEKEYGVTNPFIHYCLYATTNTNAFYSNVFNVSDVYNFVLTNYESEAHGIVYCSNRPDPSAGDVDPDTSAKGKTLAQMLINAGAEITGALSRTYATGTNRLNMELSADANGNKPYEDAGYYYITLGDLNINDAHKGNYILRLHPAYLLDGEIPNPGLNSYDEVATEIENASNAVIYSNDYKYGVSTQAYKGEVVSNVLYTIKQVALTVTANGGSKVYGNPDTNYTQAYNTSATDNITVLTPVNPNGTAAAVSNPGTKGYLNGYTVSGMIENAVVKDVTRYTSVISGYLRRQKGENAGRYYICNKQVSTTGNDNALTYTSCDYDSMVINTTDDNIVDLSLSNVFIASYNTSSGQVAYAALTDISKLAYGMYVKVGTSYYKLTRDNTDLSNKKFTNFAAAELWKYTYDDSDAVVKVIANTMNANQNYYIKYYDAIYTINPSEVIVQPGYNQGKEYSAPEHNDPIFEIIVYGEKTSIDATETAGTSFNGYTEDIAAKNAPTAPTYQSYPASGSFTADTSTYFSDRRTKTHDVVTGTTTFEYKFNEITPASGNKFTVDGVVYVVSGTSFYPETDPSETHASGSTIGVKTFTISGGKVIVTISGVLTYQTYELFTDSTGDAGKGKITRTAGSVVGWYDFDFTHDDVNKDFHVVGNGKEYCTVADYKYTVGDAGTDECANYNVTFTNSAPAQFDASGNEITDADDINVGGKYVTTQATGYAYRHDGVNYCGDSSKYSFACGGTVESPTIKVIKFFIFKRDIILSFNAQTEVYGKNYDYFKNGIFTIADKTSAAGFPTVITCYKKDNSGSYVVDGQKFSPLTTEQCKTADYGLSTNDTWGSSGLKLNFFLHNTLNNKFKTGYYPLPGGLYYVYASIGESASGTGTDGNYIHDNYNLIYVDYNALVAAGANTSADNGALKITPKPVTLSGTYYQKEFGQAKYATYASNGTALTTTTDANKVITSVLGTSTTIGIFDNHYYYCAKNTATTYNSGSVIYGCEIFGSPKTTDTNYYFGAGSNVYLYTVDGMVDETTENGGNFADEIRGNFAGTPIRSRLSNNTSGDSYGLLDDAGYYSIGLDDIIPVVAVYDATDGEGNNTFEFSVANGTLKRDTNYTITSRTSGLLYITPAQITITVTSGQTKMYGCAYNQVDTTTDSVYAYGTGYSNCVETAGQYYDLGYEYTVQGDKANYLKTNTDKYTAQYCEDMANRKTGACTDIVYPALNASGYQYTVSPDFDDNSKLHNQPANTSLNAGTMFRIPKNDDSGATTTTYSYKDVYQLSLASQKAITSSDIRYQKQDYDDYVITLGTLDAAFNSNKLCNAESAPSGDTYYCKNFIVNYGNNNTSAHVSSAGTMEDVTANNSTEFTITNADFLFTITKREVVMTTEYNYKVVDDTEPNEGYSCQDLINMFTYIGDANFAKAVSLTGRSYCTNADTFIKTGVTRYYAIDNSLAKAPWTGWTVSANNTYTQYNDILFDVIDSTSQIIRKGMGANSANRNDIVGKYAYDYNLSLYTGSTVGQNGDNYTIAYLASDAADSATSSSETTVGFAAARGETTELDRWYHDDNHKCVGAGGATSVSATCATYSGTQSYNFAINGIKYRNTDSNGDYKKGNSYTLAGDATKISTVKPNVYFEIVRREIFIETQPVNKDYGIEDKYTMFDVKLCGSYSGTPAACTEVTKTTQWGQRNSLSDDDYNKFFPSGTFSQTAFKGSSDDAAYRGGNSDRAFGIYMYRTAGEVTGEYVIVACATQSANDLACRTAYNDESTESARLTSIKSFTAETSATYNASNYIVKTIPAKITINQRKLYITPDSGQGFDYGNFDAGKGKMISPITFKENYVITGTEPTETSGLVNGGIITTSGDAINSQVALCIYDISERLTCINDRQNSSGATPTYITTGLHDSNTPRVLTSLPTGTSHLGFNVYNDSYLQDNDADRFALNRKLGAKVDERYNRNVGTYTITAGEMFSTEAAWNPYCSDASDKDCLNVNYKIVGFEENVTYTISPATIIVTPVASQSKIYGTVDVELKFTVETYFDFKDVNLDNYYCSGHGNCQTAKDANTFNNFSSDDSGVIKLSGFAYSEDNGNANYNYGNSKASNKANSSEQAITSDFASDGADNPKFYDKFCYGADSGSCTEYVGGTHEYASLKYGSTSRILLGYFYVEKWTQKVGTHNILNGISVAKNEFNLVNYLYKAQVTDADDTLVAVGADTGVDFTVNQAAITVTIVDVTKVYGQATDSHKCDAANASVVQDTCTEDYATLGASDNEGRLEYNFNVTGTGVTTKTESSVDKVILTTAVADKFYTQTGNAEYKNIHLGLTVVRKNNNANVCISENDIYGCEDVGAYELIFRKQAVPDDVEKNYDVTFGATEVSMPANNDTNTTGYAIAVSETKTIAETNGDSTDTGGGAYIYYKASGLDTVPSGQKSSASGAATEILVVTGYTGTLTINKRNIVFYVGTYNTDGTVADRFVIEENEQVPEVPSINANFTTTSTSPATKQVYYTTWFDETQYNSSTAINVTDVTHAPRQVRTGDVLNTVYDSVGTTHYGVGICTKYSDDVQAEVFGTGNCASMIQYSEANKIEGGKYKFDTAIPAAKQALGTVYYPILRDPSKTYIVSAANETKNYDTDDYNGVLVIYKDQTAPIIQVGNDKFAIEANAHSVGTPCTVINTSGATFKYECNVSGLTFDENNKALGQIISYITNNYSGYNSVINKNNTGTSITALKPVMSDNLTADAVYWPVNNIGLKASNKNTTLYDVDRTTNTYAFNTSYIDSDLEAISSIISWFNINSYDYSYIRGTNYQTKRYTPRYYFYIEGNDSLVNKVGEGENFFDPTYVGDFKVLIYAIDDVGNQATAEVTLQIIDTTKPEVSEMHIFNAPVVCLGANTNCKTNTITSWTVKEGFVPIDAFIKYKLVSGNYVEDNTNGTFIKLNGTPVDIYGTSIQRYSSASDSAKDILGGYVKVTSGSTPATEIEHKYWSNITDKYLVVVGGKDNSYIDPAETDTMSQWHTYYSIDNGTNWYRYPRHSSTGVHISVKDGVNAVFTKILDTGRTVTVTTGANGYTYYNDIYLRYMESGSACTGMSGDCKLVEDASELAITQVKNLAMETEDSGANYKFTVHSVVVNYNVASNLVTWEGQITSLTPTGVDGAANKKSFRFGIMTCIMDMDTLKVNCETKYQLVYNNATNDKQTKDKQTYTVLDAGTARNMNDWHTLATATSFYNDRRYFFIDTGIPTLTMNGDGYGVYEYDTKCYSGIAADEDSVCETSYNEEFINAADTLSTTNTSSVITSGVSATYATYLNAALANISNYTDIILYTGAEYSKVTDTSAYTTSGLLENNTLVLSGASSYTNTADAATFNKNKLSLAVYLTVKKGNAASEFFRYLAIYSIVNDKYYVIKQQNTGGGYAVVEKFTDSYLTDYNTIETVLEYIVSTASITAAKTADGDLTFSINYVIQDVANNKSAAIENVTVRGAIYTKLTSTIAVNIPAANAGVSIVDLGDNAYQISVNQGMSFASVINNLTVANVNTDGVNNLSSIRQSLYYNGKPIFENLSYNANILSLIDDYANAPGRYTLKLTSSRMVTGENGIERLVTDKPLTLDFVVNANVANVVDTMDNSLLNTSIIAMFIGTIFLIGLGYISIKKAKK